MDDSQGSISDGLSGKFTMALAADGTASMQLDCNRATGRWSSDAADGETGTLAIGPLAVTAALCPPPSISEKVARDMSYVRSYLIRDGRLYLSLMADGGVYEWEPVPGTDK